MKDSDKAASGIAEKTFPALGTLNNIRIWDARDSRIFDKVVQRVTEIERRMSAFLPDSDISRIRACAGRGFAAIGEDTFRLIQKAVGFSALSDGAFDVTLRPLVELWSIGENGGRIPSDSEIAETLCLAGYRDIEIREDSFEASLKSPGQALDLGGIAKGFAADEAGRILRESGVRSAIVNFGGNILTIGEKPDGQPWKIGILNPFAARGRHLCILEASDEAVVTSGGSEQFFIKDGIRYHHILDPRSGRPAQSGLLSVTVVGPSSVDADALSTALFVLGPEKGIPLLRTAGAEARCASSSLSRFLSFA